MSGELATLSLNFISGEYRVVPYLPDLPTTPSLLPPNTTPLERAIEQTQAAFDPPAIVPTLWNAATCPPAVLPYLAWALSADEWDHEWPEDIKRAVIAESQLIHQRKGTPWAIRRAMTALGHPDAELLERTDGWATFRIKINQPITISNAVMLKRMLEAVKRNCIKLSAIDFTGATLRHNGFARHDGSYTRGVVETQLT